MGLAIQKMFDGIAHRYDFLNHFLSLGRDRTWRRSAIHRLPSKESGPVLDLCGGTGDFWESWSKISTAKDSLSNGLGISNRGVIADFSWPMLREAARKFHNDQGDKPLLVCMDALRPCFKPACFTSVFCGFGMRNLDSLEAGIIAVKQVLKPGGSFLTLEFFRPTTFFTRFFYRILAPLCIPVLGWIFSSRRQAYVYLVDSIRRFCSVSEYAEVLRKQGFEAVSVAECDLGISHIVTAVKGS